MQIPLTGHYPVKSQVKILLITMSSCRLIDYLSSINYDKYQVKRGGIIWN